MAGTLSTYGGVIHEQAVRSLFQFLETICEGAVVVDRDSRIIKNLQTRVSQAR